MLKPLLLIFLFGFHFILCHVALTFPPARSYAFDYLDSFTFRGRGPCGERKTAGAFKTSLKANSTVTFTFHMSFVHQGGFSFTLLYDCGNSNDDRNCKRMDLTSGIVSRNDVLSQSYNVFIPNMECKNCVVLLIRQGAEYGPSYNFWSCADVSIVGKIRCTKNNNNNKNEVAISLLRSIVVLPSISQSARERYSQLLQSYLSSPSPRKCVEKSENECYEGKCQNDGTCSSTTGECRCQRLFTGDRCQYMDECWTDEDCSYHGQCIDTKSTTYPILQCYCDPGWFGTNCEKVSAITSVPSDLSRYESHQFRYEGPRIHWTYYKNYAEIEIVITLPTRSWVGIGWKSVQTTRACKDMDPVLEVERKRRQALILLRQKQVNFTTNEPSPHPDPEAENFCPRSGRKKRSTRVKRQSYRGIITRGMDCADIVVGSVKGNRHRVRDMWTRECSKPLPDEYFGGTDGLTAAFGQQVGQSTTIVFRKKTTADHLTDHSPESGQQRVIWAHGQNRDTRFCTKDNLSFYRQDELKYHRYERGRQNFVFTRPAVLPDAHLTSSPTTPSQTTPSQTTNAPVTCMRSGQLKTPSDCNENDSNFNCEIVVSWELDSDNATIIFIVQGTVLEGQYIAIGISDNLQMPETDIYSSRIMNGELQVVDRWASERSFPQPDEDQNVQALTGSYNNGILTAVFSRPKASANNFDLGFDNNQCRHILYAKGDREMSYHGRQRGFLTESKLCIPSCS